SELTLGEFMTLPALHAHLAVDTASGLVTLTSGAPVGPLAGQPDLAAGTAIDLQLQGSALSGSVQLPVLANGVPLLLSARVGGTLTDPTVVADVATMAAPAAPIARLSGSLGAGATAQATLP